MADTCTHLDTIADVKPSADGIGSFEPGEEWFWCYPDELAFELDDRPPAPSPP